MSGSTAKMLVSVVDQVVCVKITGRATFVASYDFKSLINGLQGKGLRRFIIDLSECLVMDSTFLGVLAGLGVKFSKRADGEVPTLIELLNPTPRVTGLLENLGVIELFRVVTAAEARELNFESVELAGCSKAEMSRNCLEAHRTLMDLKPENAVKFKDVAEFLARDLEQLQAVEAAAR